MKEAVGATSIFQIVILFILLFTAIMCLTINNANAFGVKDDITNIIELNKGNYLDGDNLNDEIVNSIKENQYRVTGKCPSSGETDKNVYKGYDKNGAVVGEGSKASICIKEVPVTDELDTYLSDILGGNLGHDDFLRGVYYQVIVFYQMDLPVINQVFNFQTKGETKIIYGEKMADLS
ncbi:MAG: hypothetical protein RSF02_01185 [Bacilli bacterium]